MTTDVLGVFLTYLPTSNITYIPTLAYLLKSDAAKPEN